MDNRSFESGLDDFAFNVLEKEGEVEGSYSFIDDGKLFTVMEKLKCTGNLIRYKGKLKLLYSYLKRVKCNFEETDLGEYKFVVISKSKLFDGYIMDEVTL